MNNNKKLKKRFYLFIFRETGRGEEREGKKLQCVLASHSPRTGDLAHNPGMCPDWELNRKPFGSQPTLNPLSHANQVKVLFLDIGDRQMGVQFVLDYRLVLCTFYICVLFYNKKKYSATPTLKL